MEITHQIILDSIEGTPLYPAAVKTNTAVQQPTTPVHKDNSGINGNFVTLIPFLILLLYAIKKEIYSYKAVKRVANMPDYSQLKHKHINISSRY